MFSDFKLGETTAQPFNLKLRRPSAQPGPDGASPVPSRIVGMRVTSSTPELCCASSILANDVLTRLRPTVTQSLKSKPPRGLELFQRPGKVCRLPLRPHSFGGQSCVLRRKALEEENVQRQVWDPGRTGASRNGGPGRWQVGWRDAQVSSPKGKAQAWSTDTCPKRPTR